MTHKKNGCMSCPQKDKCSNAWETAGHAECPPAWGKIFAALVFPPAAIVGALVLTESLARDKFSSESAIATVSLVGAAVAGIIVMLLGRMCIAHLSKISESLKGQG